MNPININQPARRTNTQINHMKASQLINIRTTTVARMTKPVSGLLTRHLEDMVTKSEGLSR
jgi:hypothetical protein